MARAEKEQRAAAALAASKKSTKAPVREAPAKCVAAPGMREVSAARDASTATARGLAGRRTGALTSGLPSKSSFLLAYRSSTRRSTRAARGRNRLG